MINVLTAEESESEERGNESEKEENDMEDELLCPHTCPLCALMGRPT